MHKRKQQASKRALQSRRVHYLASIAVGGGGRRHGDVEQRCCLGQLQDRHVTQPGCTTPGWAALAGAMHYGAMATARWRVVEGDVVVTHGTAAVKVAHGHPPCACQLGLVGAATVRAGNQAHTRTRVHNSKPTDCMR